MDFDEFVCYGNEIEVDFRMYCNIILMKPLLISSFEHLSILMIGDKIAIYFVPIY